MISVRHRFHGTNSLNFVYRRGQTLRSKYFSVKYVRNDRQDSYRLAVVVSRKVAKSAVVRNRIRRRLYELFRNEIAPNIDNIDVVISVYDAQLADLPAEQLKNNFIYVFKDFTTLKNSHPGTK